MAIKYIIEGNSTLGECGIHVQWKLIQPGGTDMARLRGMQEEEERRGQRGQLDWGEYDQEIIYVCRNVIVKPIIMIYIYYLAIIIKGASITPFFKIIIFHK